MIAAASLRASERLKGDLTLCSWRAGWRSLLLRGYDEPGEVEDLVTAQTPDQLVVLVTGGHCRIDGRYAGRWHESRYARGDLGMTAPGEEVRLRWREGAGLTTLQLHLPAATLADVADLDPTGSRPVRLPHQLVRPDPAIEAVMLSLGRSVEVAGSELYAETAAHFLANHLRRNHSGEGFTKPIPVEERRMASVDRLLREALNTHVTLDELAAAASLSKFHMLRAFKAAYGETPFRRLTRYRMENGRRLLASSKASVSAIAFDCGYDDPTHFATAFRRAYGVSPRGYRQSLG